MTFGLDLIQSVFETNFIERQDAYFQSSQFAIERPSFVPLVLDWFDRTAIVIAPRSQSGVGITAGLCCVFGRHPRVSGQ